MSMRSSFRFYGDLRDHLRTGTDGSYAFVVPGSVKDAIESFGVPHPEVDWVVVNGALVSFAYTIQDRDDIHVYPHGYCIGADSMLRPPIANMRFVLDVHLGKLAAYLRMLGFDTAYRNCYSDPELVRISSQQGRILLTRDRPLLMHNAVTYGYFLRATDSHRQVEEVVRYFALAERFRPFARCMACNAVLEPVAKSEVAGSLPARTVELYDEFTRCSACRRVYWKGSHYRRMIQWVDDLRRNTCVPLSPATNLSHS